MNVQTRLTRSASNKVIGGVCGGLGEYFGIDPVIVRLIFVALVFAGGMSILLYPIMWLIMPVSTTGQPAFGESLNEMRQAGQQMVGQVGEGAQTLASKFQSSFAGSGQVRYDPQTGQPLPQVARSNKVLGVALLGIGTLMLASFIPGGSSVMVAIMLLGGGYYLLRRTH
jgi:phage shock protein C